MKLRIYYTHHTGFSHTSKRYGTRRCYEDFDGETNLETAKASVLHRLGRREESQHPNYKDFAEIKGHGLVDPEKVEHDMECFVAIEQGLFSPEMNFAAISEKKLTKWAT